MRADAAPLYEIFSSIQGEASRVGERHLFVRMAGCDLECSFCDTPASKRVPAKCRIFLPSGERTEPNPMTRERLNAWVKRLDEEAGPHRAIALTGGEPLLFADYLRPLAKRWRKEGKTVLLETGGHLPECLDRMLDAVDVVMADVKLLSSSGMRVSKETSAAFLRRARGKELAVKAIVSAATTAVEVRRAARIVADEAPDAPLVLQPVTGRRNGPPEGSHLLALQRAALEIHPNVRVIPQTHKTLHVR